MRKILELTEKEFATGIAPGSHVQNRGLWRKAVGITPVQDIFLESETTNLLMPGPSPTDITGSVIVDVPFAWATDVTGASNRFAYLWGNAGHLYKIDLSSDSSPTDVSTGAAVSNPANGLLIMKAVGGTKYVLYFQEGQIGRWDPTAAWSTRTSNWKTGLQSTSWHPTHKFQDRGYYGNGPYVGFVYDNGAADLDTDKTALDFEAEDRVNAISDDGVYLVVGITKNTYTDNLVHAQSRIIFWDTNQSSWQREWPIPDASILSIKQVGGMMEAVTSRGVYRFSFDTPPDPRLPYTTTATVPDGTYPTQYAADILGGALLFGGSERVSSFGKLVPHLPTALHQPFAGFSGAVTMVASSIKTGQAFIGTSTPKLYRITYSNATRLTGVVAESIFIDLQRWYQVAKIVVTFDHQLVSGDVVTIQAQPDPSVSATTFGTASFASHGAIRSKELYKPLEASQLKLLVTFTSGAARIRNIEVWGDPISTPNHTRA